MITIDKKIKKCDHIKDLKRTEGKSCIKKNIEI